MVTNTLLFLPGGPLEIALILLVFVVLFGPKKVPQLAKAVGESMGKFEKGKREAERELQQTVNSDEEEAGEAEEAEEETEEEEN